MRWQRITLWLSISILAIILLVLAWLWTADLGAFKPQLERFVTEKTGREFSIHGDLHIDFARHSSIIAEDVHFQNADWADQDDMVTVGRIEVRLDLWSLVAGPVLIELIDVDNASILLINPETGEPNWVLPIDEAPESGEDTPGFAFLVRQIDVDNLQLVLDSARRTHALNLQLDSLRQQLGPDGQLELDVNASLNGRTVKVAGKLGTWDALLAAKDIRYDLSAVLDTVELTAAGHIDDLVKPVQPEAQFTVTAPDIDDLTLLLGIGDEGSGDIKLSGSLQKDAGGKLAGQVNGNIGETEIQYRGTVSDLQNLRDVDIEIAASGPDLGRILRIFGIHQVRDAPFRLRVDAETQGGTLIVNEANLELAKARIDATARMPKFPSVDDAIIALDIEGQDIARFRYLTGVPGAAEGAFFLHFTVDADPDGLELLRLDFQTSLGKARASGKLGDPPGFFSSQLDFELESGSLGRVANAYGIEGLPDAPIHIAGAAEYVKGGIRTLKPVVVTMNGAAASIDGSVSFAQGIAGSDLGYTLEGPDLASLVSMFAGATGVPEQAYELRGRMQARDDGFRFREGTGKVGSAIIAYDGQLTATRGFAGTTLNFRITGPALEDMLSRVGDLDIRPGPFELSGRVALQPDLLAVRDLAYKRPFGNLAANLELGLPASRKWLDFDVRGRGNDVRGLLQGLRRFEAYEQPFSLDLRGSRRGDSLNIPRADIGVGDATMQAKGNLSFAPGSSATEFNLSLAVPSLARLGTFDDRRFNDQGISILARIVGGDGIVTVDQLTAKLGESDVGGFVQLRTGVIPDLEVDVHSDALRFAPLLEEEEFEYDPAPEFEDGRFIPDIPIPFAAMRKINASVDVDIGELQRDKLLLKDIVLDADLRDGNLQVSRASSRGRSGAITARAKIEPTEESGIASVELVARQFGLGLSYTDMDVAMKGDIDIKLESKGADLRTLLGNANGIVYFDSRGGRMTSNIWLQRLYGDLLQEILSTINPFRQSDPYTDFKCVVIPLQIDKGMLTSEPGAFIATNRIYIAANPSINLKTEALNVLVRTTPTKSLTISAAEFVNPYVKIVGTLASPRLAVDEKGVLISGGAAVATGGLTLLARGVWDRLSRSGNPCEESADKARAELEGRFPELTIEDAEKSK